MPGPIIAIGGGEIKDLETLPIDREIVRLAKKKQPNALFIPTASHDAPGYCEAFHTVYGKKLGCKTDVLLLLDKKTTQRAIKEKIAWADLVYVGGGNTLYMMNVWRKRGVGKELVKAWRQGTVMAGLSAGSICWFEKSLSDSRKDRWTQVTGLGLIPGYHSPHMDREPRRVTGFERMMRMAPLGTVGYAIDDRCAVIFEKGEERVLAAKKGAAVRRYERQRNAVLVEVMK